MHLKSYETNSQNKKKKNQTIKKKGTASDSRWAWALLAVHKDSNPVK